LLAIANLAILWIFPPENYGKANKKIAKRTEENNDENKKHKTMTSLHHVGDNCRKK
jgi:hypothetical protein